MKREIFKTADGSTSIHIPEWNESYHSKHGAIQEAKHVFIKSGLKFYKENHPNKTKITILECGLGTHLNALLTAIFARQYKISIDYIGVEAYPIEETEWQKLNFNQILELKEIEELYQRMFSAGWEKNIMITDGFEILKRKMFFQEMDFSDEIDLVYFDAFGPRVQPELWSEEIFTSLFKALKNDGVLVTYSAKGSVRRTLQEIGFQVEKIKGPPGKREMIRAFKE